MSLWDKTSKRPVYFTDPEQRRRIVGTDQGWVLRRNFAEKANTSNMRTKDEVLVPIGGLANSSNMGSPSIAEIYAANTTGGDTIKHGVANYLYVVFDEPIKRFSGTLNVTIANTAGGSANVHGINAANDPISNANNTLRFAFTPGNAGTYKVQAQTIANTAANHAKSLNAGNELASLVISGAVSNTYGRIVVA